MDFEKTISISLDQYLHMIELKTAVLLAASLQMGAISGGAGWPEQQHIYNFGKNLGLAFQVQDDWLDSFGDPEKFGKQKGGDILANKKTFLLVHALDKTGESEKKDILKLLNTNAPGKVEQMIELFRFLGVDKAAEREKNNYMQKAYTHLEKINVPDLNKEALKELAAYLLEREL